MSEKQSAKTSTNGVNNPPKIRDMTLHKVHAKRKTYRLTFAKSATNTTALFTLANGLCKKHFDRTSNQDSVFSFVHTTENIIGVERALNA